MYYFFLAACGSDINSAERLNQKEQLDAGEEKYNALVSKVETEYEENLPFETESEINTEAENGIQLETEIETEIANEEKELETQLQNSVKKNQLTLKFDEVEVTEEGYIRLSWENTNDPYMASYDVMRKKIGGAEVSSEWIKIAKIDLQESDEYFFEDEFEEDTPVQYAYRLSGKVREENAYEVGDANPVICSNMKICIDPGHYRGANGVDSSESYGYYEGNYTLEVAQSLKKYLEEYGIQVIMTRDTLDISLDGYTNEELDHGHISLRGEYAGENDCDLFLSIHTNSNLDNANGYATDEQPNGITKVIVLANQLTYESPLYVELGNLVGEKLSAVNYQLGLSTVKDFQKRQLDDIPEWTDKYNDSLDTPGTIMRRTGTKGDYYGVLRGAAVVGVPGMIIEHAHHSVKDMRKLAAQSDLADLWAKADAEGISEAFMFQELVEIQ